uniref:hypothetical protein n=1 Tax=Candidatus Electrothrix sp. TaxID=2170559 RepID=UPI0040561C14
MADSRRKLRIIKEPSQENMPIKKQGYFSHACNSSSGSVQTKRLTLADKENILQLSLAAREDLSFNSINKSAR